MPNEDREPVSADEFGRRIRAAAWDEMDKQPHPTMQMLYGGAASNRLRKQPTVDPRTDELEAKLRAMDEEREDRLYRPRQSRWWHWFWPFR
jgi:hypothetical protein